MKKFKHFWTVTFYVKFPPRIERKILVIKNVWWKLPSINICKLKHCERPIIIKDRKNNSNKKTLTGITAFRVSTLADDKAFHTCSEFLNATFFVRNVFDCTF